MPAQDDGARLKAAALRDEGTLNPASEKVADPKFQQGDFFDPHDLVQVKYEMLRRVGVEHASVTHVAEEYGVSRPTYYETKASFEASGLAGLVPKKRGPRGPHKLQGEVLAFLEQHLSPDEPIRARTLAQLIRQHFDLTVHPRTIERAVRGKETPTPRAGPAHQTGDHETPGDPRTHARPVAQAWNHPCACLQRA